MSNPLATVDFFVLEAGESLDRLDSLISGAEAPPAEGFLRTCRVLRGSALMAGQQQIARAAAGLEMLARTVRDGRRSWDAGTGRQVGEAIGEFRQLIGRVRDWSDSDTARAVRLGALLEGLGGRSAQDAAVRRTDRAELNAGVRAFVAREGALIASALDRAARTLRAAPGDREPLYTVIRRMQSLRGLAELGELVPLPEILDGIELAVGDLTRLFAPPPGVDEVIAAAATALTRISRDIAEQGRPDPEAEEARRFTELLLRAFAVERDVVPIESLYYTGDPEPLTPPLSQPRFDAPAPLGPLELVSHGEHLHQIADLIAGSRSATERDLRLYHLLGALRSAAAPGPDPVAAALGVFARSAREGLAAGVAARSTEALVACLRDAGELLRGVADASDRMLLSRRLLDVAHRLDQLRTEPASAPAPAPLPEPEVVPIESLAYDGQPAIVAEALVVPIESLAPEPAATALERTFSTFGRLLRERGTVPASLPALVGLPAEPAPAPIVEAIGIEELCYRGRAALERAATVRQELAVQLVGEGDLASIRPLIQELLDLVPLALAES
jgi:hypothetical protein